MWSCALTAVVLMEEEKSEYINPQPVCGRDALNTVCHSPMHPKAGQKYFFENCFSMLQTRTVLCVCLYSDLSLWLNLIPVAASIANGKLILTSKLIQ